MAALTRSGARKASEIVMFTFRTLQPSRPAMLSVRAACPSADQGYRHHRHRQRQRTRPVKAVEMEMAGTAGPEV